MISEKIHETVNYIKNPLKHSTIRDYTWFADCYTWPYRKGLNTHSIGECVSLTWTPLHDYNLSGLRTTVYSHLRSSSSFLPPFRP